MTSGSQDMKSEIRVGVPKMDFLGYFLELHR